MQIRKRYPLAPLILVTAWGCEKISEYIHVGFDAYLEKDKNGAIKNDYIKDCLRIASQNAQKRIKSKFSPEELESAKIRLDCMEKASKFDLNLGLIAAITGLLEQGIPEEEINKDILQIKEIYSKKGKDKNKMYRNKTLMTRSAINKYIKIYERKSDDENIIFVASPSALKVRQLLKENPTKWPRLRKKHASIKKFIADFNL